MLSRFDPWRHRFTVFLACCTVVLLAAGGLVTSTGSGLAVPDWPLSFGQVFPPMQGGVLFEHGHRLVAAFVGLLTVVLAAWFRAREARPWVRRLAYLACGAVVLQGLLGGLTVLLRLPVIVSVAHACLAQGFFCLVVVLALSTSLAFVAGETAPRPKDDVTPALRVLTAVTTGMIFGQLVLGALMRHTGAGLAIPDVPLAFGRLVPPFRSFEIAIHFAHRVGALLVAGAVLWTAARVRRHSIRPDLRVPARFAAVLVVAQILLGAVTVMTRLAVVPATAHVVVGALLLAASLILAVRAGRGAGAGWRAGMVTAGAEGSL
jgi:cytochrome c oxidase assembly protein subunit 15